MRTLARLAAIVLLVLLPAAAPAQAPTTNAAVERLFTAERLEPGWFTPEVLAAVSVEQLAAIIADLTGRYGALIGVEGEGSRLTVHLERADLPAEAALDGEGRIAGIFFRTPIPRGGDLADHVAAIAALPGDAAVLVTTNGAVRAAEAAEAPLAVGSAAKLAILRAVADAAEAGRLGWDEVVRLKPEWRSLPTGILQDWPEGTPLTVATLATLMISISDNTATDALVGLAGREAVAALTPRNTPFPTTAELFKLKAAANRGLYERFAAGDAAARAAVLAELAARPLPAADALTAAPAAEWFMTAAELCALLEADHGLPALSVNPGLAEPADWTAVTFKGGSDDGVLNYSTLVTGRDGRRHCVVATWNGAGPLDEQRLAVPYRGILAILAAEGG